MRKSSSKTVLDAVAEAGSKANDADVQLSRLAHALEAIVELAMQGGDEQKSLQRIESVATIARAYVDTINEMNADTIGTISAIKHIYAEAHSHG